VVLSKLNVCGKVISISRPHDSQEIGAEAWKEGYSDDVEREGQELTSRTRRPGVNICVFDNNVNI
jgi:hypothetical protein